MGRPVWIVPYLGHFDSLDNTTRAKSPRIVYLDTFRASGSHNCEMRGLPPIDKVFRAICQSNLNVVDFSRVKLIGRLVYFTQ